MYSTIVIGGGPGGYACAIRAAQLGGNVCLIEKNGLGGTCTQRGCIPTKYLHSLGDIIRRANGAKRNGLNIQKIELNYKFLKSRMYATVSRLASAIKLLLKSNGVDLLEGEAHMISQNKVKVNDTILETKNIVIATGSYPVCLQGYEFGEYILSTSSILELEDLPRSITIVGGGYSGCEFASILNALGCKVSLIESQDHLMPIQIQEIGNAVEKYMRLDGINVMTKSRVEKIIDNVAFVNRKEIVAENIMGRKDNNGEIDYRSLPVCVFTYPEVAFVGDLNGRSGEFSLAASAKANCLGDTRGIIKVFENEGKLVGTYIIAPHAGEIIAEAALAIKMNLRTKDIFDTIHAHPTLPESFAEAVRDISSESIHHLPMRDRQFINRKSFHH